jgi:hypothetical protein
MPEGARRRLLGCQKRRCNCGKRTVRLRVFSAGGVSESWWADNNRTAPVERQARRNRGVSAFGLGADPGRPWSTRLHFHVVTGAYHGSTEQQRAHRGKRHRDMRMRSRIKREQKYVRVRVWRWSLYNGAVVRPLIGRTRSWTMSFPGQNFCNCNGPGPVSGFCLRLCPESSALPLHLQVRPRFCCNHCGFSVPPNDRQFEPPTRSFLQVCVDCPCCPAVSARAASPFEPPTELSEEGGF